MGALVIALVVFAIVAYRGSTKRQNFKKSDV